MRLGVMKLKPTYIEGVFVAETEPVSDARGSLTRLFCEADLQPALANRRILQINHSLTHRRGAVRGMHLQLTPHAEMKMVRCLRGRVWDVAIDLREGSPTFRQWHAEELSPDNRRMMILPEGCAHGFQVLAPESELLYLHTTTYAPASERGFHPEDPALSIAWPLPVSDLSARDAGHALLDPDFRGVAP